MPFGVQQPRLVTSLGGNQRLLEQRRKLKKGKKRRRQPSNKWSDIEQPREAIKEVMSSKRLVLSRE